MSLSKLVLFSVLLFLNIYFSFAQHTAFKQKITHNDRNFADHFGTDVSISGNYAIISAFGEDDNNFWWGETYDGAVYVFEKNANGVWQQVQKVVPVDRQINEQIRTIRLHGDYFVIGSEYHSLDENGLNDLDNAGAAYIYERNKNSGVWEEVQKIVPQDREVEDHFGHYVALHGNTIVITSLLDDVTIGNVTYTNLGSASVYNRDSNGTWVLSQQLFPSERKNDDLFGCSVSLHKDIMVVGVRLDDEDNHGTVVNNAGSAYIYRRINGTWSEVQKITANDRGADDWFGIGSAVHNNRIVVGGIYHDIVHNGTTYTDVGAAYVYEENQNGTWIQISKLSPSRYQNNLGFGGIFDLNDDYIIVGASEDSYDKNNADSLTNAGSAFIYKKNASNTWELAEKVDQESYNHYRGTNLYFGFSISVDNSNLMIGAIGDVYDANNSNYTSYSGSAYFLCLNSFSTLNISACDPYTSPNGKILTKTGTYYDTLTNSNGCDSIITINLAFNKSNTDFKVTACDTYKYNGVNYTNSGTYKVTYTNKFGCDSIVSLKLTLNNKTTSEINIIQCGDYTTPSGKTLNTRGVYYDTIANGLGCDSIIKINFSKQNTRKINVSRCDNYNSPSGKYTWTKTGKYQDTIFGVCDTIYTIDLTIKQSNTQSYSFTSCESFTSQSKKVYTSSGNYTEILKNKFGCDSTINLTLTINKNSKHQFSTKSYYKYISPNNKIYTKSGTYIDTIPNGLGCDSIITINLIIGNNSNNIQVSKCQSYTSPSGKYIWSKTGTYQDTLKNSLNYDSIITINLTIGNQYINKNITSCDTYTSPSGKYTWTTSGIYFDTTINNSNCYDIQTINLTINKSVINNLGGISSCENYIFDANNSYNKSGTYSVGFKTSKGCDSTVTFNLTIHKNTTNEIFAQEKLSYTSPSGKYIWQKSGTYFDTIPNGVGCDSILTIHLDICNTFNSLTISSCDFYTSPSGKYKWGISGIYFDTLLNSKKCDSIISIILIINKSSLKDIDLTSCETYTDKHGITYTESGKYTSILTNKYGCDSTINLNITIHKNSYSHFNVSSCEYYMSPALRSLTKSGVYTDIIPNGVGCDSIIRFNLDISHTNYNTIEVEECDEYVLPNGKKTVYYTGTYIDTIFRENKCDSVIKANVVINYSYNIEIKKLVCTSYKWLSNEYTESGIYSHNFYTSKGCDSIVNLNLVVSDYQPKSNEYLTCIGFDDEENNVIETKNSLAFTPNQDGMNDYIVFKLPKKGMTLNIFDTNGTFLKSIHSDENIIIWDGKIEQSLNQIGFSMVIYEIKSDDGLIRNLNYILIIRN